MLAKQIFKQSNGAVTKAYYSDLEKLGPVGVVALNLFRAQKCSTRAKKYRGGIKGLGSYRDMAYDRKQYSMQNLCEVLGQHGASLGIVFGWKIDPREHSRNKWVLYVDIPTGQASFHCEKRFAGPDYQKEWDGGHGSENHILEFCDSLFRKESCSTYPKPEMQPASQKPSSEARKPLLSSSETQPPLPLSGIGLS
jgi:hypothetical protein